MKLKKYTSNNPSRRNTILLKYIKYHRSPLKGKRRGLIKTSGRNHKGKITTYHRGGGNKQLYRNIGLQNPMEPHLIEALEYDPNRSAVLVRLFSTKTKKHFYAISPQEMTAGQIYSSKSVKVGSWLSLKQIPLGSKIHCVGTCFRPKKAVLQRSAGTYAQIIQKSLNHCLIKLSSGKVQKLKENTKAVIGIVSNSNYRFQVLGKAGRKRRLGLRPKNRGVAMNSVDHPHGGGEGKSSEGRPSVTPWAKPTHGKRTRKV